MILAAAAAAAHGNVGVFGGSGHTIRLEGTEQIQLVGEEVEIRPRSSGAVEYRCVFDLRNLTDERVEVQVGFPLDGRDVPFPREPSEVERVQDRGFIARTVDETFHVRFVTKDVESRFESIFLWTMSFEPDEALRLHVSYELGLSFVPFIGPDKETAPILRDVGFAVGSALWFGYVTATGQSWAGEIERARFRVSTMEFERSCPWIDGLLWVRVAWPEGAQPFRRDDTPVVPAAGPEGIEWVHAPFEPGPFLSVQYLAFALPRDPEGMRERARKLVADGREDLGRLRAFVRACYGVPPKDKDLRKLVEAWGFPLDSTLFEHQLSDEAKALLAAIDAVRDESRP